MYLHAKTSNHLRQTQTRLRTPPTKDHLFLSNQPKDMKHNLSATTTTTPPAINRHKHRNNNSTSSQTRSTLTEIAREDEHMNISSKLQASGYQFGHLHIMPTCLDRTTSGAVC
ncbi:hypothetical protein KC19_8G073600 [Ceratodon purpureus]|uniref:Uncharacterized protein n=1 Tax=Ceratodon purpureus TaxID=3225 RepID=A0A8T0GZW3_CERPU|nr:hypothetical protein KC19_8G073600 [Ceratodon purpureus]